MTITTWCATLHDRPLELALGHDAERGEVVVWVDGTPTLRLTLPEGETHTIELPIDGHAARVRLVRLQRATRQGATRQGATRQGATRGAPNGAPNAYRHEATLDGAPLRAATRGASDGAGPPLTLDAARYDALFPQWRRACAAATGAGAALVAAAAWRVAVAGALTQPSQGLLLLGLTSALSGALWWWTERRRVRELLAAPDLRPGVVVSLDPVCVAVPVDLAFEPEESAPAVVVVEQPLDRLRPVQLGERVPMIVSFDHTQDGRLWHGLTLLAVECAAAEPPGSACELPAEAWEDAEVWLRAAGGPTSPGHWHIASPVPRTTRAATHRSI